MALTSCTVPAAGQPDVRPRPRTRWSSASASTASPVASACRWRPRGRSPRCSSSRSWPTCRSVRGDGVIAFVNGLGGTPLIELYVMYNEVNKILSGHGVTVARSLVGLLHHVAGDGGLVGHAAQGRRRAALAVGRAGQDTGTAGGGSDAMTDHVTTAALDAWVRRFAALVAQERDHLTELDSAIGDADHGANLDRGMTAAVAALDDARPTGSRRRCSSKVGMTLVSTVGGASGPLYGTLLPARAPRSATPPARARAGRRRPACRARGRRRPRQGRGRRQDDVRRAGAGRATRSRRRWPTGVDLARRRSARGPSAADAGRDATIPMLARKGRASYLGERSVGHQDPGATSRRPAGRPRRATAAGADAEAPDGRHDVGIVVVSHSRALAAAAVALAARDAARPAGADRRSPPGWTRRRSAPTPSRSSEAIEQVDGRAGVVVLMDLGSAVLSAELALDLLDDPRPATGSCCRPPRSSRGWSSPRSPPPAARAGPRSPPRRGRP